MVKFIPCTCVGCAIHRGRIWNVGLRANLINQCVICFDRHSFSSEKYFFHDEMPEPCVKDLLRTHFLQRPSQVGQNVSLGSSAATQAGGWHDHDVEFQFAVCGVNVIERCAGKPSGKTALWWERKLAASYKSSVITRRMKSMDFFVRQGERRRHSALWQRRATQAGGKRRDFMSRYDGRLVSAAIQLHYGLFSARILGHDHLQH